MIAYLKEKPLRRGARKSTKSTRSWAAKKSENMTVHRGVPRFQKTGTSSRPLIRIFTHFEGTFHVEMRKTF